MIGCFEGVIFILLLYTRVFINVKGNVKDTCWNWKLNLQFSLLGAYNIHNVTHQSQNATTTTGLTIWI